jgi:hypothetical protein
MGREQSLKLALAGRGREDLIAVLPSTLPRTIPLPSRLVLGVEELSIK